ncbi:hypothetical protein FDH01_gp250 [Acinetobacter phage vB_AbaM_ME3]|uniref:Uncharacterized protein n=1 Tax=Acinetobacter phage vB_AbaM_ME3 TaxID=1837876 RepID=A0A172Q0J2_9CAUD|nr:hypothetical protein FDH01_gp250 [Acinetobacter phage vB_AbaM_ME3]AND75372.1 hypothetical protein ME3_211 [Acinetobacter phage vB_AbaM_ME3]
MFKLTVLAQSISEINSRLDYYASIVIDNSED